MKKTNTIYISGFEKGGKITYYFYRLITNEFVTNKFTRFDCYGYFKSYQDFRNTLKKYGLKDRLTYIDEFTNDRYSTQAITDYLKYTNNI